MRFAGSENKACRYCVTLLSVTNRLRGSINKSLRSSTLYSLKIPLQVRAAEVKKESFKSVVHMSG